MDIDNSKYYHSGNLSIQGDIYGEPDVKYLLITDSYLCDHCPSIVASSYDKSEIESLKRELEKPFKLQSTTKS